MNPQSQPHDPTSLPRPVDPVTSAQGSVQPAMAQANHDQNAVPQSIPQSMPIQGSNKSTHSPDIAEDVDLIEKEWVEKAKHIVSQTKDNPNEQNSEISKLKADYMKKRYNKDIDVE